MSASLVGSEMCIRDSHPTCPPASVTLASMASWIPLSPVVRQGPAVVPVSYTHLTLPTICSV
eukprot:5296072-Alexandrium_andersonii.AAC.1